jgi:hypothetical protein
MSGDPFANRAAPGSPWSDAEIEELSDLLHEGYGIINAVRLYRRHRPDRSVVAVARQAATLLGHYGSRRPGRPRIQPGPVRVRTQIEVAALMGVGTDTVAHWTARGWLPTIRTRRPREAGGRHPIVYIHDTDIHALLERREAWPAFDPERITDPDLRAAAEETRREAGGHWDAAYTILRREGYAGTAGRYVRECPAPLRLTTWRRVHYIWSADVPAFAAWLRHPAPRPKKEIRYAAD